MASKRIVGSAVNWAAIGERVPENQRMNFLAFKTKCDSYVKRLLASPENPPKIDWSLYQKRVPIAGMVDSFQKSYESLKVPYPVDNYTKLVDEQEIEVKSKIADFKAQSVKTIQEYQRQLDHLNSLIPYDQMTMEDFKDSHPEMALDPVKKPTFWPHDEEEQIDYRDKDHPLYGTDPHGGH